jgi:hypothetical protein
MLETIVLSWLAQAESGICRRRHLPGLLLSSAKQHIFGDVTPDSIEKQLCGGHIYMKLVNSENPGIQSLSRSLWLVPEDARDLDSRLTDDPITPGVLWAAAGG